MTKTEQNRVLAWRLRVLREASMAPRSVAQTCRHFGLSRKAFYKWKSRYDAHGEAGLGDQCWHWRYHHAGGPGPS